MKKELKTVKVDWDTWKKLKLLAIEKERSIGKLIRDMVNKKRVNKNGL